MTTVTAWCRSRSSRATAVVCSGRKRPQDSNGQWDATPRLTALVGGGDEAEQELGAGVVERREAEVVDDHEVGPQQALDEPADAVVGEPAVERLDEGRRGEVADPEPRLDRGVAEGDQGVALAGARRADEHEVLARPDPLEATRGSRRWAAGWSCRRPGTRRASCAPGSRPPAAVPGRWTHRAPRARPRAGCAAARRAPSAGPWPWRGPRAPGAGPRRA